MHALNESPRSAQNQVLQSERLWASLHQGIDSTQNIVANEVKYRADVRREYGALPDLECLPSELNQVFLNLLVNAAHAIDPQRGLIVIRSGAAASEIWIEVKDDGCGIAPEHLPRVFDTFFDKAGRTRYRPRPVPGLRQRANAPGPP